MAINEIVGKFLRQAASQILERFAAVLSAIDDDPAVAGAAFFIFGRGNKPSNIRILRVNRDRESEDRWLHVFDFDKRSGAVNRPEDAVVMLDPEDIGIGCALHQAMHVLIVGIVLLLFGIVLGPHSAAALTPGLSGVASDPDAAGGNADADVL